MSNIAARRRNGFARDLSIAILRKWGMLVSARSTLEGECRDDVDRPKLEIQHGRTGSSERFGTGTGEYRDSIVE